VASFTTFNSRNIFLACIGAFALALVYYHLQLIFYPYPLDYNESGQLVATSTIASGGNPYSLENQPMRISMYPVIYNIIVVPFSQVLGNTFELHRAVAGAFILGCCCLTYYACRASAGKRTESLAAATLLYAGLLFYATPVASPNAPGLFLFLAAILIPLADKFSTRSLAVSIALGILAFYTKQYFIASLGYVALYMFLAVSKQRAILYGVISLVLFLASLITVSRVFPYYLEDTIFAVQASAEFAASDERLLGQFKAYAQVYLPLLLILCLLVIARLRGTGATATGNGSGRSWRSYFVLDLGKLDKPLLSRGPDYIWLCCACSVVIIAVVLGKNAGNYLSYLFQFISPFLLAGIFASASRTAVWQLAVQGLTIAAFFTTFSILPRDFSVDESGWERVQAEIDNADDIYASTLVLREVLDKGGPVYLSGGTRYFILGSGKPDFLANSAQERSVADIWEDHVLRIQSKLENREFDVLLIDQWLPLPKSVHEDTPDTMAVLKEHYKITGRIKLSLAQRRGGGTYRMQIWKPKEN